MKKSETLKREIAASELVDGWQREIAALRRMMKARETPYEEIQEKVADYTERCLHIAQSRHLPIELSRGKLRVLEQQSPKMRTTLNRTGRQVVLPRGDMSFEEVTDFIEAMSFKR